MNFSNIISISVYLLYHNPVHRTAVVSDIQPEKGKNDLILDIHCIYMGLWLNSLFNHELVGIVMSVNIFGWTITQLFTWYSIPSYIDALNIQKKVILSFFSPVCLTQILSNRCGIWFHSLFNHELVGIAMSVNIIWWTITQLFPWYSIPSRLDTMNIQYKVIFSFLWLYVWHNSCPVICMTNYSDQQIRICGPPGAGYKFIEDRFNDYEKHKFKFLFGKSHFDDGSSVFNIL